MHRTTSTELALELTGEPILNPPGSWSVAWAKADERYWRNFGRNSGWDEEEEPEQESDE